MAKKEATDKNAKPAKDAAPAKTAGDAAPSAAGDAHDAPPSSKRKKLILLAGIGGTLIASASVGGFFLYKTFGGSAKVELAAQPVTGAVDAKGDGKDAKAAAKDHKADGKDAKDTKDAKGDAKAVAKDGKADTKDAKDAKDAKDSKDGKAGADTKDTKDGDKNAKAGEPGKEGEAKGTAAAGESGEKSAVGSARGFGETYEIPRLDLNLSNPLENRYLRLALSVEYRGGKEQAEELKKREPQLRDLVITSVSSKTRLDLLSDRGKGKLRRELLHKFNEVLDRPVANVFFTEFLVE